MENTNNFKIKFEKDLAEVGILTGKTLLTKIAELLPHARRMTDDEIDWYMYSRFKVSKDISAKISNYEKIKDSHISEAGYIQNLAHYVFNCFDGKGGVSENDLRFEIDHSLNLVGFTLRKSDKQPSIIDLLPTPIVWLMVLSFPFIVYKIFSH